MEAHILDVSHYSHYYNDKKKKESFKEMTKNIFVVAIPAIIAMTFAFLV
jgi:hypothetical protein